MKIIKSAFDEDNQDQAFYSISIHKYKLWCSLDSGLQVLSFQIGTLSLHEKNAVFEFSRDC